MVLPIDAIVVIYYSGAVNLSENRNQITVQPPKLNPAMVLEENHVDTSGEVPGLFEFLVLLEKVSIKVIRSFRSITWHVWN